MCLSVCTQIVFVGAGGGKKKKKKVSADAFGKVARMESEVEKFAKLVEKHNVKLSTR